MNNYQSKKTAFTLIEFLIALVIIGFIVAILVGVFSSPLKQAKTDSAVSQVKDGLRQIVEAGQSRAIKTGLYDSDNVWPPTLASGGYLTAVPAIPAGIDGSIPAEWSYESKMYNGGCGASSSGKIGYDTPWLGPVNDDFCKAYNKAQGLAEAVIDNCAIGDCTASGGSDEYTPVQTAATTFCYKYGSVAGDNMVAYLSNSGVSEVCP